MERRINKVQKKIHLLGLTAFLVSDIVHIRYLTGLKLTEKGDACLLITGNHHSLITDGRYQEAARKQIKTGEVIIIKTPTEGNKAIAQLIKEQNGETGFEAEDLTVGELQKFERELSDSAVPGVVYRNFLSPTENLIEDISSIKDQGEIKKIRKAAEITDHIFQKHILNLIKPGIKESKLTSKIRYLGEEHGAEGDAFKPIVLFGSHSSLPHGESSNRTLKIGDIIQLDFGYFYQGYCSDFSRVLILGQPTEEQKKIHKIVLDARKRAIEAVKPGMKEWKLDKVARDFIEENGHKFIHGLGHGIGIKIHTKPHITKLMEGILKPGQIFTVEPGIYIPGWGGMRIEDDILVTKDGYEVLTKSSKELIIL